jgi:hypothetical protein
MTKLTTVLTNIPYPMAIQPESVRLSLAAGFQKLVSELVPLPR